MRGGERPGPMGAGPATGWGRGFCGGTTGPGVAGGGRAVRGRRSGRGQGWRWRSWETERSGWRRGGPWAANGRPWREPFIEDEVEWLQNEATALETELERVKARLGELEGQGDESA